MSGRHRNKKVGLCLMVVTVYLVLAGNAFVSDAKAQSCVTPPPGLVSWWDGDSVSGDIAFDIQNGNDGTLMQGATVGPGKVGQAFSFDGLDDKIVLANPAAINFASPATVSAWVKLDGNKDTSNVLFSFGNNTAAQEDLEDLWISIGSSSSLWDDEAISVVRICFSTDPVQSYGVNTRISDGTNPFDGCWHLITITFDAQVTVFLDAISQTITMHRWLGPNTGEFGGLPSVNHATIGVLDRPTDFGFFDGLIDEVAIYNRALTDAEIQAIYNAGSAGKCKPTVEEMIISLAQVVMDLNLQQGISNSLDAKLAATLQALDDVNENNDVAAINSMEALINAVEAQRGKHISEAAADALIATALQIISMLSP